MRGSIFGIILATCLYCLYFSACPLFIFWIGYHGQERSENVDAILKEYFYIREFHMDRIVNGLPLIR